MERNDIKTIPRQKIITSMIKKAFYTLTYNLFNSYFICKYPFIYIFFSNFKFLFSYILNTYFCIFFCIIYISIVYYVVETSRKTPTLQQLMLSQQAPALQCNHFVTNIAFWAINILCSLSITMVTFYHYSKPHF